MDSKNKSTRSTKKTAGFDLKPIFIIIGILALLFTLYIAHRASISEKKLFSISFLALFSGTLYESFRISEKWKNVLYVFIGTYFFSLISFLPGKHESNYHFDNHIESWPYYFIFFYALAMAIFNKNKVTAKLTEGITLLLSLSLIYWTIDYGFVNIENLFVKLLLIVALLLSGFSILNALTYIELSKTTRLTLSIWSTVIMFSFAIDNVFRVFNNEDIENTKYLSQGLYIGLQYFLLGVSAVYIMQNYLLLVSFLPSKNGNYKNDLKELKKEHIDRYSAKQVNIGHSLLCILYSSSIYILNYKFQILPRHTMIWLVFLTFPLISYFTNKVNEHNSI